MGYFRLRATGSGMQTLQIVQTHIGIDVVSH